MILSFNPLKLDTGERLNTLKKFVCNGRGIIGVCLNALRDQGRKW